MSIRPKNIVITKGDNICGAIEKSNSSVDFLVKVDIYTEGNLCRTELNQLGLFFANINTRL